MWTGSPPIRQVIPANQYHTDGVGAFYEHPVRGYTANHSAAGGTERAGGAEIALHDDLARVRWHA